MGRLELREFLACPRLGRAARRSLCEVPEVICPDDSASWLPGFVFWLKQVGAPGLGRDSGKGVSGPGDGGLGKSRLLEGPDLQVNKHRMALLLAAFTPPRSSTVSSLLRTRGPDGPPGWGAAAGARGGGQHCIVSCDGDTLCHSKHNQLLSGLLMGSSEACAPPCLTQSHPHPRPRCFSHHPPSPRFTPPPTCLHANAALTAASKWPLELKPQGLAQGPAWVCCVASWGAEEMNRGVGTSELSPSQELRVSR